MAYQNALVSENVKIELQNLTSEVLTAETEDVLNSNLRLFQNTIESVCTPLFKKNIVRMIVLILKVSSHGIMKNVS